MPRMIGNILLLLILTGCGLTLEYKGDLTTGELSYHATLRVKPDKEEATLTLSLQTLSEKEVSLAMTTIDLIAPSGAQSIPQGKTTLSHFLLTKGQKATVRTSWRLINDPSFYQLYGMAGEDLPETYTLNVGGLTGHESVLLTVRASEKALKAYQKHRLPILAHYTLQVPPDFETIQKNHLLSKGWITRDEHDNDESAPSENSISLIVGDYTILMDSRYYVGLYGFSRAHSLTLRVIFANREAERILFVPQKLALVVGNKTITPRVKKSLTAQKPDKEGYPITRNQRGEWLLEYPLPQPADSLTLMIAEAFVSPTHVPLFGVPRVTLKAR